MKMNGFQRSVKKYLFKSCVIMTTGARSSASESYHVVNETKLKLNNLSARLCHHVAKAKATKETYTSSHKHSASVYVHWPYCKRRCSYCNFNKYIDLNVDDPRMTGCLEKETSFLLELSGVKTVTSVFFGGGTPSLARPSTISSILEVVNSVDGAHGCREVTLEVNPTGFETDKLKDFKSSGVNRVSVGIQTLDPQGLSILGREHSPPDSLRCLEAAKKLFPGRVSVDLIFGWPGQRLSEWLSELEYILPLCDNHVSLYQLTLERGTLLYKLVKSGSVKSVDDEEQAEMYLQGMDILCSHGFERYEVSNFAKEESYCIHNMSYWSGQQYIGVGPGSHGRFQPIDKPLREARIQTPDPNNWMREVEKFGHATRLACSSIARDFNLGQVMMDSVDVRSHIDAGLVHIDSGGVRATEKGINILDSILPDLLCAVGTFES